VLLGIINLVAIILLSLLSDTNESHAETEKKTDKKPIYENKVAFHENFRATVKEHKRKRELLMPTLVSLLVAVAIYLMFSYNAWSPEIMIFFALCLWFIVFISLTFMFKDRITKSFRALLWTKLYIILLAVSIALTSYDYYQTHKDYQIGFHDYLAHNFLGIEKIPTGDYILEGEGIVLGTGLSDTTGMVFDDILSETDMIDDIVEWTGTVVSTSVDTLDEPDPIAPSTIGNQTLMDAVLYLLKKYEIPLNTKKDISFSYVSFSNENYAARRTAYERKMIGKTTNPTKYIVCESYIVMKWLLEKWNVVYTSTNVLEKFRAEAVKRDALNGCVKGKIVSDKTL